MNIINITNDDVTEYIHEHYIDQNEELAKLRKIGDDGNVPIIQQETEMILNTLLTIFKPKKILEIGTAIGYSALYFATKCEGSHVFTIEKDEYAYKAAKQNIEVMGFSDRITQLFGDGQEQIEKLRDAGERDFDLIFIDAAKSHYKRFFESALEICGDNPLIISDNILQRAMTANPKYDIRDKHRTNIKKMREYVDFICNDQRFETSIMAIGDGLALTLYREGK